MPEWSLWVLMYKKKTKGHSETAKLLVELRASLEITDNEGQLVPQGGVPVPLSPPHQRTFCWMGSPPGWWWWSVVIFLVGAVVLRRGADMSPLSCRLGRDLCGLPVLVRKAPEKGSLWKSIFGFLS